MSKRVSEEKLILDSENNLILYKKYKDIITRLIEKYDFKIRNDFKNLVNFSTNKSIPIHSWYDYKHGYAKDLVWSIIEEAKPSKELYILDPFCGVGTTNLVAKELGYNSIGTDVNPMAYFTTKVKLADYNKDDLDIIFHHFSNFKTNTQFQLKEVAKVILSSFTEKNLDNLLFIRGYIEEIENIKVKNLFLLAYLSIIEDCSIRVKDGNGLKLKKNKKQIEDVYQYFIDRCLKFYNDLQNHNHNLGTEHIIINGSTLNDNTLKIIKDKKVGISIFSPPYANCFDYCEVYKLELWLGGFVEKYEDFAKYRGMALRSHVNSKFDHNIKNFHNDVDDIANLISTYNIWNKNIPDMIRGYFDDMYELLNRQSELLIKGGKCYIVVANSGYKGIIVPTDLLICELAEKVGYKVNNIFYARKIRASGQQNTDLHKNYDRLMRETIIELELL